jgi:hypothetical protein
VFYPRILKNRMFSNILAKKEYEILIFPCIQENICYTQNYVYYNTDSILF